MMYIVTGSGDMPAKAAREILEDQWDVLERETPPGEPIMVSFIVEPQEHPGGAHDALMQFLGAIEIPFSLVNSPGGESFIVPKIYDGYEENYPMAVSDLVKDLTSQNEPVRVLALFQVPEESSNEDAELEKQIELSVTNGAQAFMMNAAMFEIVLTEPDFSSVEPIPDPEPVAAVTQEPDPSPAVEPVTEPPLAEAPLVEEDLQSLTRAELTAMARDMDVTPQDWRTKQFIIDAILGKPESSTPEPEGSISLPVNDIGTTSVGNATIYTSSGPSKEFTLTPKEFTVQQHTYSVPSLSQADLTLAVKNGIIAALKELLNSNGESK